MNRIQTFLSVLISITCFNACGRGSHLDVVSITSDQNTQAWFTPEEHLPIVSLCFSFQAGLAPEKQNQAGISHILAQMLMEGTSQQSSHDYKNYLMNHPIQITVNSDKDKILILCRTSVEYLPKAAHILKQILYHPRFDPKDLNRIKSQTKINTLSYTQDPQQRVQFAALKKLLGDHPYAYSSSQMIQSLQDIKAHDLRKFMKQNFTQDRLKIGICGNLSQVAAASLIDDLFHNLPKTHHDSAMVPVTANFEAPPTHIHEDIPQSIIVMLHPSLSNTHPDFMKLYMLCHIIGGNMNSRLWHSIREQQGLAYQVDLEIKHLSQFDYLKIHLGTDALKAERAIRAVQKIWQDVQRDGITQKELERAKTYLIGSSALSFVNSSAIAQALNFFQDYGYQPNYFQKRKAMIESITLQQINDFAKGFFNVNRLSITTIGKHRAHDAQHKHKSLTKKEK